VLIQRTMHLYEGGGGGLTLPDAEADRARLRDRVHLERLMSSPAYVAPLRGRPLE
jgi:hypothetical protein